MVQIIVHLEYEAFGTRLTLLDEEIGHGFFFELWQSWTQAHNLHQSPCRPHAFPLVRLLGFRELAIRNPVAVNYYFLRQLEVDISEFLKINLHGIQENSTTSLYTINKHPIYDSLCSPTGDHRTCLSFLELFPVIPFSSCHWTSAAEQLPRIS